MVEARAQGLIFPELIGNPALASTAALKSVKGKGKRQPCTKGHAQGGCVLPLALVTA